MAILIAISIYLLGFILIIVTIYLMEKNNKFIAWGKATTLEQAENETDVLTWNYAVDLNWQPEEETKPLKLTMEQIAEKFNAEKIEIVNYGK